MRVLRIGASRRTAYDNERGMRRLSTQNSVGAAVPCQMTDAAVRATIEIVRPQEALHMNAPAPHSARPAKAGV